MRKDHITTLFPSSSSGKDNLRVRLREDFRVRKDDLVADESDEIRHLDAHVLVLPVQGGPAACTLAFVDIKTKVLSLNRLLKLKLHSQFDVNKTLCTT